MEDTMKGKQVRNPFVVVIALALLLIGGVVSEARATAPGKNGKIAFRRYLNGDHTWGALFVSESDGSGARQVTRPSRGVVDDFPDWSADGKLLVFQRCASFCAVYVVRPDGTGLKDLSPADGGATDESLATFLPDGRHIVFTRASGGVRSYPGGEQINHSDLVVMNLEGGALRVIASAAPYKADFENAMFAPDGTRLVYEHRRSGLVDPKTRRALVVATANGRTRHRITPWDLNAGDGADWSPDGTRILFRSHEDEDDTTQSQLFQIHPDGTHMEQLTHLPDGTLLLSSGYSPDGKWIVYATTGKGGAADVRIMQLDGSHDAPVTQTTAWDSAPDWGPK
jgi:TolB protein